MHFESLQRRDVGQDHERAQRLSILPMENRAARAQNRALVARAQGNFPIFLALAGSQRLVQNVAQRFRQIADLAGQQFGGGQAGNLLHLAVKNGDQPVAVGRDHTRG